MTGLADLFGALRELGGAAILRGGGWWPVVWLGVVILAAGWVTDRLAPWLGLLGAEREATTRRRARALALVGSIVLGVGLTEVALVRLPLVAFAAAVVVLPALLIASGLVLDLAGGLILLFRLRPAPGDLLRVGPISGHLLNVGVMRTRLSTEGGAEIFVPNRQFARHPIHLEPTSRGRRLVVTISSPAEWKASNLTELRSRIALLPYRLPGTPIGVELADGAVVINAHVWTSADCGIAERAVHRLCEERSPAIGG